MGLVTFVFRLNRHVLNLLLVKVMLKIYLTSCIVIFGLHIEFLLFVVLDIFLRLLMMQVVLFGFINERQRGSFSFVARLRCYG